MHGDVERSGPGGIALLLLVEGPRVVLRLRARAGVPPVSDDIRPRGTVQVKCSAPECTWEFWVDALDPRLPDGPFLCSDHDGSSPPYMKAPDIER